MGYTKLAVCDSIGVARISWLSRILVQLGGFEQVWSEKIEGSSAVHQTFREIEPINLSFNLALLHNDRVEPRQELLPEKQKSC